MTLAHLDTLIAFAVLMLGVSIIITILTQLVSTALGLRGTNLLWGIQTVLRTIDPALEAEAERILRHSLISDSVTSKFRAALEDVPLAGRFIRRWTLASAIRPEELVRMLALRARELRATGDAGNLHLAERIDAALYESDPETARKVRLIGQAFHELAPSYAVQVDKSMDQMTTDADRAVGRLEAWFNTGMDRVSERFSMQMRVWTVAFAFVLAIFAQLDTFRLVERLWSDPQARASLVASRDVMMKEAVTVMRPPAPGAQPVPGADPDVYSAAFAEWKPLYPAETKGIDAMPAMPGYDAAQAWLKEKLNVEPASPAGQRYARLVSAALARKANEIRAQLESSGLQLIPSPYRFLHFDNFRNVLGILISAALLSLGAPFWFNALKSLTNLRPILAQKQDK